jgi:DNA-binding CsgD family transcriptional regulator
MFMGIEQRRRRKCSSGSQKFTGGEDLSDEERLGRPPDLSLDEVLAHRLEADSRTTARKIADSLGISSKTVVNHLRDGLGMKCFHLQWVPHTLAEAQKATRVS